MSGFLITGILDKEFSNDRFSIVQFYERRVRRIFPALISMLALVAFISWFVLLPLDFKEFGESLAATSLFLSNAYFNIKSGYFANSADFQPLLHTWSLGVEEQFYIVFPLICVLLYKFFPNKIKLFFFILWLVSFLSATDLIVDASSKNKFYLPWYRAWEFLTGSLLAVGFGKSIIQKIPTQVLSFIGLTMIVVPVFLYTKNTPFPGLTAVPPVIGTALIILSGMKAQDTFVYKILSLQPVRYMGKISYSLYLWHWPPLVFVFYISGGQSTLFTNTIAVAIAVLIASLSYRFIETPFRNKNFLNRMVLFSNASIFIVLALAFGVMARVGNGIPERLPEDVAKVSQVALDINPLRKECDRRSTEQVKTGDVCQIGAQGISPSFAVVGDSFGDAFIPGFDYAGTSKGKSGLVYTYSGCYPLLGTMQGNGKCDRYYTEVVEKLRKSDDIKKVFLVARWSSAVEASRVGLNTRNDMFLTNKDVTELSVESTRLVFQQGLETLLASLEDKEIYIVAFIPEQHINVPRAAGIAKLVGNEVNIQVSRESFEKRQLKTRDLLTSISQENTANIIDVSSLMCDEHSCLATKDEIPLYVDDNHISTSTAVELSSLFIDVM
ncbi:acyltransferase family protein [Aestuariibacter sp. A3R04]|uniref:acyltransferase family protein n=1 Tax=Aestuariibacter sp. A3R04 TaxID=2841571 RepID=UPI001C080CF0|nr:acyltransferase [Aestuariibacter sp. A3R04]